MPSRVYHSCSEDCQFRFEEAWAYFQSMHDVLWPMLPFTYGYRYNTPPLIHTEVEFGQ